MTSRMLELADGYAREQGVLFDAKRFYSANKPIRLDKLQMIIDAQKVFVDEFGLSGADDRLLIRLAKRKIKTWYEFSDKPLQDVFDEFVRLEMSVADPAKIAPFLGAPVQHVKGIVEDLERFEIEPSIKRVKAHLENDRAVAALLKASGLGDAEPALVCACADRRPFAELPPAVRERINLQAYEAFVARIAKDKPGRASLRKTANRFVPAVARTVLNKARVLAHRRKPMIYFEADRKFGSGPVGLIRNIPQATAYTQLPLAVQSDYSTESYRILLSFFQGDDAAMQVLRDAVSKLIPRQLETLIKKVDTLKTQKGTVTVNQAVTMLGPVYQALIDALAYRKEYQDLPLFAQNIYPETTYEMAADYVKAQPHFAADLARAADKVINPAVQTVLDKAGILLAQDAPLGVWKAQELISSTYYKLLLHLAGGKPHETLPDFIKKSFHEPTYERVAGYLREHPRAADSVAQAIKAVSPAAGPLRTLFKAAAAVNAGKKDLTKEEAEVLIGYYSSSMLRAVAREKRPYAYFRSIQPSCSEEIFNEIRRYLKEHPEDEAAVHAAALRIVPAAVITLKAKIEKLNDREGLLSAAQADSIAGNAHVRIMKCLLDRTAYDDTPNVVQNAYNQATYEEAVDYTDVDTRLLADIRRAQDKIIPNVIAGTLDRCQAVVDQGILLDKIEAKKLMGSYYSILLHSAGRKAYATLPPSVTRNFSKEKSKALKAFLREHPHENALVEEAFVLIVPKALKNLQAKARIINQSPVPWVYRELRAAIGDTYALAIAHFIIKTPYDCLPKTIAKNYTRSAYAEIEQRLAVLPEVADELVAAAAKMPDVFLLECSRSFCAQLRREYGSISTDIDPQGFVKHRAGGLSVAERRVVVSLLRSMQSGEAASLKRAQSLLEQDRQSPKPLRRVIPKPAPPKRRAPRKQTRKTENPYAPQQEPWIVEKKPLTRPKKNEDNHGIPVMAEDRFKAAEKVGDFLKARGLYMKALKLLSQIESGSDDYDFARQELERVKVRLQARRSRAINDRLKEDTLYGREYAAQYISSGALLGKGGKVDMLAMWLKVSRMARENGEGRREYATFSAQLRKHGPVGLWRALFVYYVEEFFAGHNRLPVLADMYNSGYASLYCRRNGDMFQNYVAAGYADPKNPWYLDDLPHLFSKAQESVNFQALPQAAEREAWEGAVPFWDEFVRASPQLTVSGDDVKNLLRNTDALVDVAAGAFGFDLKAVGPYLQAHVVSLEKKLAAAVADSDGQRSFLHMLLRKLELLERNEEYLRAYEADPERAVVLKEELMKKFKKHFTEQLKQEGGGTDE